MVGRLDRASYPAKARASSWASGRSPYSIMVDASGDRFANESESYVDLGHHMLEHDKDRSLLVGRRRSACAPLPAQATPWIPARTTLMVEQGIMVKAGSISELATKLDMEPSRLVKTVDRFNFFCALWRRRRPRAGQLGIRPLLRGPDGAPQPVPGPAREGRRSRHSRSSSVTLVLNNGLKNERDGGLLVRGRLGHRRLVLGGQQRRIRDGADLPWPRLYHRTSLNVRLRAARHMARHGE